MGLGEEHDDAPAPGREVISVAVGPPGDEPFAAQATEVVGGLTAGVGRVEESGNAFGELVVVEPGDEMAEAGKGGQHGHDPRLAEAEPGSVETGIVSRSGHLQEGGHVGGGLSGCGFGVAETPVG